MAFQPARLACEYAADGGRAKARAAGMTSLRTRVVMGMMPLFIGCSVQSGKAPASGHDTPDPICARLDPASKPSDDVNVIGPDGMSGLGLQADPRIRLLFTQGREKEGQSALREHVPVLIAALRSDEMPRRYWAAVWLSRIGDEAALAVIGSHMATERHVRVLGACIGACLSQGRPEGMATVAALLGCDRQDVRDMALSLTKTGKPTSVLVEPLMALWRRETRPGTLAEIVATLAAIGDARALPVALEAMEPGGPLSSSSEGASLVLLDAIGTRRELTRLIDAYRRNPQWPPTTKRGAFMLMTRWGGVSATAILREAFERETEEEVRQASAAQIVKAQLEPDKPMPPENRSLSGEEWAELSARQAPYVEREVRRLLDPALASYVRLAWTTDIETQRTIPYIVLPYAQRLPLEERIAMGRALLALAPDGDSGKVPVARVLVTALMERANAHLPDDPEAARADANEAAELARTTTGIGDGEFPDLVPLVERAARMAGGDGAIGAVTAAAVAGAYDMGTGDEEWSIELQSDGAVSGTFWSDSGSRGTIAGRYGVEKGFVILTMTSPRVQTQVLVPASWGERNFLVPEAEMAAFCNRWNESRFQRPSLDAFYVGRKENLDPGASLRVPDRWRDLVLQTPILATITEIRGDGTIRVRPDRLGLHKGMSLLGAAWGELKGQGTFEITAVQDEAVDARPLGTADVHVGQRISTSYDR